MKTPIIEGLTQVGLESYLSARQYSELYWPNFFPIKNVNSLDGKTLIGSVGSRVKAFTISYDAKSPQVGRKTLEPKYFDIPKTSLSVPKSEKEILEHYITKSLQGQNAVIEDYFNDADTVIDACNANMEFYALQALSKTKFQLSTTNNPQGIVNETVIDFGMPSANKKVVSVVWSTENVDTMDPIADFKAVVKAARGKARFVRMLMDADTYDLMTAATKFQAYFKNTALNVVALLSLDTINALLRSYELPPITVIDTSMDVEAKSGKRTALNPFESNHVTFIPEIQVGQMYNGPIAEELEKSPEIMYAKKGNILVSVQKFSNPVSVLTKGECNVFPSWPSVDRCYSMYTGSDSTWA